MDIQMYIFSESIRVFKGGNHNLFFPLGVFGDGVYEHRHACHAFVYFCTYSMCQVADRVGVYVGSSAPDYMGILLDPHSTSSTITGDENLGSQRAMLANKISDFFGFKGLN